MEITRPRLFLILCLLVHSSSLKILKRQKRNWIIDSFTIREDHEGGFPYELGLLQVENKFTFSKIHGQGVEEEPKNILKINENTGMLTVHGPVDYEKFRVLKLTFQAYDQEKKEIDTQLGVEILIIDANDNPPIFEPDLYEVSIEESTPQGTEFTTIKANDDDSTENNRLFDFKIISVIPDPFDLEFYLTQFESTATVSFKGCLDHEKADAYIIKVEAKDRGEEVQLSSFATIIINIEDGNNHLPVITGQSGSGRVKEGEENVLVKRLQVTDRDTKGTSAWRAKYQIKEDENRNFKITTDPETNEGLLYVEKPLDYEESHEKHLNISVQNEASYYSCKVERRSTTGLWKVNTIGSNTLTLSTTKVIVIVEDVNDPPIFDMTNKHVTVAENTKAGLYLATFAATDPDPDPDSSASTIVYTKGDDPADWVTVDPKTGNITTTKIIDRESHFVKDNTYKVTTYAADNGLPPMTGTATLNIHITDENDNVPQLTETTLDICQSDGLSQANITAFDLDQDPFGGPFSFKLQEKEKGKWKIDPTQVYTTKLVKERTVHSGEYDLVLKVSGFQGEEAVYNLSVIVCNCVDITKPNCRIRKAKGSGVGGGALGIIFLSMLLLSAVLLLVFLLKCKTEHKPMPDNNDSGSGHLITSNIEKPGTDCNVELVYGRKDIKLPRRPSKRKPSIDAGGQHVTNQHVTNQHVTNQQWDHFYRLKMEQRYQRWCSWQEAWARHADQEISVMQHTMILKVLQDKLYALSAPEEELGDYDPHNYTEEGDEKHNFDLDAIFIPDIPFDPELDLDLDFRFDTLASICLSVE